jgi:transposase
MDRIAGIDISKQDFVVAILTDKKPIIKKFTNNKNGFNLLLKYFKKLKIDQAKICMEATGKYGENLANFLYKLAYQVSVVNPACIKAFAHTNLARNKTDATDALLIANYASKCNPRLFTPKKPILKEIQEIHRCIQDLKSQLTQVTNRLENIDLLPGAVSSTWQNMASSIKTKIEELQNYVVELILSDHDIKQDYENLQTIPGIASISAIAIIAEVPSVDILPNARTLAAYAGLNPKHRISGSSVRGKTRISKIGSGNLRKVLYFPAVVSSSANHNFQKLKQKMKSKGKHNMVIIVALMRKLLHIIFAILKNKSTFSYDLV